MAEDARRRVALRTTFDGQADRYDRARPTYPVQLFDDLARLAHLPDAARIVEIGPGTGQATVPLAERGFRITAIELGARLAMLARANLARFPQVEVVNADFETWEPTEAGFDAVVAFTSVHWIAPEIRWAKPADLLGDRGSLAIVTTEHVLPPDGDDFFVDVQADYEAEVPDDPATGAGGPNAPETIPDLTAEIDGSGLFRTIDVRRYQWEVTYAAGEYIDLLGTYSNHRAFDAAARGRLLDRVRRRIEVRPGGQVRKTYLAILHVAERA